MRRCTSKMVAEVSREGRQGPLRRTDSSAGWKSISTRLVPRHRTRRGARALVRQSIRSRARDRGYHLCRAKSSYRSYLGATTRSQKKTDLHYLPLQDLKPIFRDG